MNVYILKRAASYRDMKPHICHLEIYGALLASADGIHVRYYGNTEPVV